MTEQQDSAPPDQTASGEDQTDRNASLADPENPPRLEPLQTRLNEVAYLRQSERFDVHINPLVAAAGDLLAQVVRLAGIADPGEIHVVNERLRAQVRQFETAAEHRQIPNEQVIAARYVLCTVLDETVLNTGWGGASDWSRISLLSCFHKETVGGEKFFHLLERLSINPHKHLHLLELMYLCFALGFEGKYRVVARRNSDLDEIREGLFRQIRHLRGNPPREFSPQWRGIEQPAPGVMRIVPRWQVALITGVCLAALYGGFAWVLGEQRETVLRPFQQITSAEPDRRL